ncbi:adenosine deaminase 2-A-like [Eurosta solidaginis]|uniref:adenosine deaminase 2-A-like n=1 Tax=Eurosta solidaginis TaxID=178769 RepID=UPI0035312ED1
MTHSRWLRNVAIFLLLANCLVFVVLLELPTLMSYSPLAERVRVYETMRANTLEREANIQLGGRVLLNANERVVNEKIMLEKRHDLEMGMKNLTHLQVAEHFFRSYVKIQNTTLFRLLQAMPKGAVLHAHDMALCSSEYLLQLTYREHLWICIALSKYKEFIKMHFALLQPQSERSCEWMLLSALRSVESSDVVDKKLLAQLTLYPHEHFPNEDAVWRSFRNIFRLVIGLLSYAPVWEACMHRALEEFYADGVQYLEIRSVLPVLYDLHDGNFTILNTTHAVRNADLRFRALQSDWIGSRLIYAPTRKGDYSRFIEYLGNALLLKFPVRLKPIYSHIFRQQMNFRRKKNVPKEHASTIKNTVE